MFIKQTNELKIQGSNRKSKLPSSLVKLIFTPSGLYEILFNVHSFLSQFYFYLQSQKNIIKIDKTKKFFFKKKNCHIYAHDWALNEARKTGRSLKITSFFSLTLNRCDSCSMDAHIIFRKEKYLRFAILRKIILGNNLHKCTVTIGTCSILHLRSHLNLFTVWGNDIKIMIRWL